MSDKIVKKQDDISLQINNLDDFQKFIDMFGDLEGFTVKTKPELMRLVMLSQELGTKPMTCITLHKELTNDRIQAILKGKELGFNFQTSFEKIYVFRDGEGKVKTSIATELAMTLAYQKGVRWKIIKNFEPIYGYQNFQDLITNPEVPNYYNPEEVKANPDMFNFVDIGNFKSIVKQAEEQLKDSQKANIAAYNKVFTKGKINIFPCPKPIDRVTTLLMSRGNESQEFSFYYSTAINAGLIRPNSAWAKYPNQMMIYRAFNFRVFCPDVANIMTHSEAEDVIREQNLNCEVPQETFEDIDAQVVD